MENLIFGTIVSHIASHGLDYLTDMFRESGTRKRLRKAIKSGRAKTTLRDYHLAVSEFWLTFVSDSQIIVLSALVEIADGNNKDSGYWRRVQASSFFSAIAPSGEDEIKVAETIASLKIINAIDISRGSISSLTDLTGCELLVPVASSRFVEFVWGELQLE